MHPVLRFKRLGCLSQEIHQNGTMSSYKWWNYVMSSWHLQHAPSSSNGFFLLRCDSFKGPTHPLKKCLGGHSCHTTKVLHAMSSPANWMGCCFWFILQWYTLRTLKAAWSKIQPIKQVSKSEVSGRPPWPFFIEIAMGFRFPNWKSAGHLGRLRPKNKIAKGAW